MRKLILSVCLVIAGLAAMAQSAKHVVLISIDGLRPEFYLDKSWNTPNLQSLMQRGVYARAARSVFPSITYPAHTSIITGAFPRNHGVLFNVPFQSPQGRWYWNEDLIKTPTLWDAVAKANLTSGSVMWPVTVGAPVDFLFPVMRATGSDKTDQLTITKPLVKPVDLMQKMENSIGKLSLADLNASNTTDETIEKMAGYIIRNYRPNLMAIHFITVDHQEHEFGRNAQEVRVAVARVDSLIGTVVKSVEDAGLLSSTVFIVTGDHGMIDTKSTFSPNVLLAQNGLITKDDWKARFVPSGGSAFLYLKDKNDKKTLRKVRWIFEKAPANLRENYSLIKRRKLRKLGANADAAMALAFVSGTNTDWEVSGEVLKVAGETSHTVKGDHGYHPDIDEMKTGFIIAGPGVKGGGMIEQIGIQDIAPIISEVLDLDFKAPDGKLIPGIFNKKK